MKLTTILLTIVILSAAFAGCREPVAPEKKIDTSLKNVPAQRLNYRFETDVEAPGNIGKDFAEAGRDEKVQADFDENRPFDVLDRTFESPDKKRVLAVFRTSDDVENEYRLDVYDSEGKLLRKITHDEMAVHFPGTIVWSPDSTAIAFIAMLRGYNPDGTQEKKQVSSQDGTGENTASSTADTNANIDANANVEGAEAEEVDPTAAKTDVLTFRTEQIYLANANGGEVKPLTQTDGLVYFYMNWAPDSGALTALASTITEWKVREMQAAQAGEMYVPAGRLRLLERNGRERLLDDYATSVRPVWSPDSAKVAIAFDKEIRVYDAIGDRPSQAAIPLRNQLLLAAKEYEANAQDEDLEGNTANSNADADREENNQTDNANKNANSNANENVPTSTLPDEANLVAFNPIISLVWEKEDLLYLETGYVKNFVDKEEENRRSYLRWHRLVLSSQAGVVPPT